MTLIMMPPSLTDMDQFLLLFSDIQRHMANNCVAATILFAIITGFGAVIEELVWRTRTQLTPQQVATNYWLASAILVTITRLFRFLASILECSTNHISAYYFFGKFICYYRFLYTVDLRL